ncbi:hypothetical protein [Sphingorhabdus sp.]|uniref:hypothetical protein n=1 Tax=Sphingorhabdus sp. TaxID=1902408 RepID=UPI0032B81A30
MSENDLIGQAESIPFSRATAARVVGVPTARLNNWLDRNEIWQTDRGTRFHRYYRLKEIFDLAGFAQMRLAGIPERRCAQFVRNYGFYRGFLHLDLDGTQSQHFSMRDGEWQLGVFDPNAVLVLTINMRELAVQIFSRIASDLTTHPNEWPKEAADSFSAYYKWALQMDRLPAGSIPTLEYAGCVG